MRNHWVFNIGTGDNAPPPDWLAEWGHHAGEMWFPPNKRPSGVRAGDRAVLNGSQRRGFLAVVEVLSTGPEPSEADSADDRRRWPYRLRHSLLVAIRADERAPSLEDVGWENSLRLRRQPHVSIDERQYRQIADAIVAAAARAVSAGPA
jgi:hypothetical protein